MWIYILMCICYHILHIYDLTHTYDLTRTYKLLIFQIFFMMLPHTDPMPYILSYMDFYGPVQLIHLKQVSY